MTATEPSPAPALLTARQVARLVGVHESHWRRLSRSGLTPAPVRVGPKSVRWRPSDVSLWIDLGCPSREKFEALRKARAGSDRQRPRMAGFPGSGAIERRFAQPQTGGVQ